MSEHINSQANSTIKSRSWNEIQEGLRPSLPPTPPPAPRQAPQCFSQKRFVAFYQHKENRDFGRQVNIVTPASRNIARCWHKHSLKSFRTCGPHNPSCKNIFEDVSSVQYSWGADSFCHALVLPQSMITNTPSRQISSAWFVLGLGQHSIVEPALSRKRRVSLNVAWASVVGELMLGSVLLS